MLFDKDLVIEYPKDQILRASGGRWQKESVLRVENLIYSEYISDGTQTVYFLPYELNANQITIYLNDLLDNRNCYC